MGLYTRCTTQSAMMIHSAVIPDDCAADYVTFTVWFYAPLAREGQSNDHQLRAESDRNVVPHIVLNCV